MSAAILVPLLVTATTSATPLLLAALGELVTERAGVLNLGVEGMMLTGAVSAFAVMSLTGSHWLGVGAGAAAGGLLSLLFGVLTLTCGTFGNVLRFLPPLVMPEQLLDEALDVLDEVVAGLT